MNGIRALSRYAYPVLELFGTDKLFRYLNREKILILAYHGITSNKYAIPPRTLLPVEAFEKQIKFVGSNYNVISLKKVIDCLTAGRSVPKNSAVLTFDDGYRNNLSVALPILEKYNVPATVFVTAGYVGTHDILPLDEVYLVVAAAKGKKPCTIAEIGIGPLSFESDSDLARSCDEAVAVLKQYPVRTQRTGIAMLKNMLGVDHFHHPNSVLEDFYILSHEELQKLSAHELIDIGSHTVNHQILATAEAGAASREIADSKTMLEGYTGKEVRFFAYPNGRPQDYNQDHIECLKKSGYTCSVTLTSRLNSRNEDIYRLNRLHIGYDFAHNLATFALKISGFNHAVKSFLK